MKARRSAAAPVRTAQVVPLKSVPEPVSGNPASYPEEIRTRIERVAYEYFEKRGCAHGHDLDDWLAAERAILRGR